MTKPWMKHTSVALDNSIKPEQQQRNPRHSGPQFTTDILRLKFNQGELAFGQQSINHSI
jgi:hypothetical protein